MKALSGHLISSIVALFLTILPAHAEKLHVLIAVDGNAGLGPNMDSDRIKMTNIFYNNVKAEQLNLNVIPSKSVSPESIKKSISKLNVKQTDTLVLYYSGHGAFDRVKNEQFLQTAGGNLYRSSVYEEVNKTGCKFFVLLTDCCNVKTFVDSDKREPVRKSLPPNNTSKVFTKLFLEPRGVLDITASQPGEYAFIDTTGKNRGSLFTFPFVSLLKANKNNEDITWKNFVKDLKTNVNAAFKESYPTGYKSKQFTQTVHVYRWPNNKPTIGGPRFGARGVYNNGKGVRLTEILRGSPAQKGGFEINDVIIKINGKSIRSESDYSDAIDSSPQIMQVQVLSNGVGKPIRTKTKLAF